MEKLNIAEILKDCPTGMELDCTMYDNVTLIRVDNEKDTVFPIKVSRGDGYTITLTKYGQYTYAEFAKCVIFPKGKTTWEGFQRPFKDGDIVVAEDDELFQMFILKEVEYHENDSYDGYCYFGWNFNCNELFCEGLWGFNRLATEEEKQKLFKAIKDNGYRWNAETKTLEKLVEPKFKVGDRIRHKTINKNDIYEISNVYDDSYGLVGYSWMFYKEYEDQYELVPNKLDISTLKPFDKVLVRHGNLSKWNTGIFSHTVKSNNKLYCIVNTQYWEQCIPYEGNEHLVGTTNDCDEYYKTW